MIRSTNRLITVTHESQSKQIIGSLKIKKSDYIIRDLILLNNLKNIYIYLHLSLHSLITLISQNHEIRLI